MIPGRSTEFVLLGEITRWKSNSWARTYFGTSRRKRISCPGRQPLGSRETPSGIRANRPRAGPRPRREPRMGKSRGHRDEAEARPEQASGQVGGRGAVPRGRSHGQRGFSGERSVAGGGPAGAWRSGTGSSRTLRA